MKLAFIRPTLLLGKKPRTKNPWTACCSAAPSSPAVTVIYDPLFSTAHVPPPGSGHPERPDRVRACISTLEASPLTSRGAVSVRAPTRPGASTRAAVERVHTSDYVAEVERIARRTALDSDTYADETTFGVGMLAASAWVDAAEEAVRSGRPSVALVRPPGHHATRFSGMGFCIFSNAAVAAVEALESGRARKVAILDWDVHHGNGTENIVSKDGRVRMVSSHQWPGFYPNMPSGAPSYVGKLGNIRNVALPPGTTFENGYEQAFAEQVLPFVTPPEFEPDLMIVSAGYDALASDGISAIGLEPSDFGKMTSMLIDALGHTKIVFGLEGGYELSGLTQAVMATITSAVEKVDAKMLAVEDPA